MNLIKVSSVDSIFKMNWRRVSNTHKKASQKNAWVYERRDCLLNIIWLSIN